MREEFCEVAAGVGIAATLATEMNAARREVRVAVGSILGCDVV